MKLTIYRKIYFAIIFAVAFSCARINHIRDKYPENFYKVPKLLTNESIKEDGTFIIYSDNQAGWRAYDVFYKRSNWTSSKMLLFPFYEIYLIGNGLYGGINWLRRIPDFGQKERLLVRDLIYKEAKKSNAQFILNIGDIATFDGRRSQHWATFIQENKIESPLLNEIPYLPVIGNHEYANDSTFGYSNFRAIFDYPRFYVQEIGNMAIYVIDSNFILDQNQFITDEKQDELFQKWFVSDNPENMSWLEEKFSTCKKKFKIVAMHHPPLTYGKHHEDWTNSKFGNELILKRNKLLKLFESYNVQVVFSGHEHLYQHNLLTYKNGYECHLYVGGGGGTPLRDFPDKKTINSYKENFHDQGINIQPLIHDKIYHYYTIETIGDSAIIKTIKVNKSSKVPTEVVDKLILK